MEVYKPINCSFYDILEAHATKKRYVRIQYFTDIHEFITVDAIIKDLYIKPDQNGKAEFMLLNTGLEIRLDRLVSVDGKLVPGKEGFDGISCECD